MSKGNDKNDKTDRATERSLEAILMVVDEPVNELLLAQVLEIPTEAIRGHLQAMAQAYLAEERGFELREVAGGWRFYSHPESASAVERFVLEGQQAKLTQAAQPANKTHAIDTGRVISRQRWVRVGCTNFKGRNMPTVNSTTMAKITLCEGATAKRTSTTMFQQAGKPEKLLSLVFIRVSEK